MASPNPIRRSLTPQRVSSLGHGDKHGYTLATSTATLSATEELAYSYTLRAALLTHLLLPRSRRLQHIPAPAQPRPHTQRSSLSIPELIKDFSVIRDTKSTRFPSGFTNELDKRITGVLVGKERLPEYQDPLVKRTFAAFLNEFKNPTFRKSMEKDRRVEDLLLIFFSKATTELQKGKTQDDDNWKLMVDRHVALFVRLISSTLKGNDWARDRPELSSRLQTIEAKLLAHSQDLADDLQRNGGAGGSTVEVEIPTSYAVKDMSGVLRVGQVFQKTYDQLQADIDHNKDVWTVKAALADLKLYQMRLSVHSDDALGRDNFATSEAYDLWKKNETQNLSLQIVAIIRAYPDLTKSITEYPASANSDNTMPELSLRKSHSSADSAAYALDPSAYLAQLNLQGSAIDGADGQGQYTFIPPDARATYLCLISKVLRDDFLHAHITSVTHVLSKAAADTLSEAASRWRMPDSSRRVLMLEAMRAAYTAHEMSLDKLDNALTFAKSDSPVLNSNDWTITDQILLLRILQDLNTALHAEIQALLEQCFASKPPSIGPAMYILEEHIRADPAFHETQDDIDECTHVLSDVLRNSARQAYNDLVSRHVPENAEQWTFEVVLQLGRAVNNLGERIRKRYRKNPEILGVSPLAILTEATVPPFSKDAEHIVKRVIDVAADAGEELPITDGFELYKELIAMRSANQQASPAVSFDFDLENVLAPFVWRWVASLDTKVLDWTVEAFSQDTFETQAQLGDDTPTDQERHSVSAMDIFRIFTQCVDQLLSLEWGDDLQHAQFMTAASKAIGASVAKYCELVEQQFVKEMDQLTPEQEVAARQTLQEKWLQVAKEALATKDKIEPFQFSPASLVKLNDIEYTILRLDDIEKMMDVDVCAEKLRQHEQLKPKVRQVNKYVFTIKIIEAENLQPCDSNGLSDPYVVIGDEYQKRLAKTRIIYENLNPRWDETVDISTTGPLHIVATIWDWDSLGDHDCVGRTSLKLDPAHFSDYLPREFWLDLDTQGRLLLRISMEGERDDIQFHFGKAFRTLKRAERDMTRKITDKLSHFIQQSLSRRTLRNILGQGLTISSVKAFAGGFANSYFAKGQVAPQPVQKLDAESALKPLFTYFDDNFAIMKQTLTDAAMISVMTRVWKEVLSTVESLLVPPISDKPSLQRPLMQQEVDIVYKWLRFLFDFFHAEGDGVPLDVLRSPKYHDLQNLNFFYFESTDNLIRTSETMASATYARQNKPGRDNARFSAPPASLSTGLAFGSAGGVFGTPSTRRSKSIMMTRNLGTMRKAKEEKRKDAQAEPSDDMILRILRMRPEAERYLRDRSRQRERLAAHAAAEQIVKQSIMAQKRSVVGGLQRRVPSTH